MARKAFRKKSKPYATVSKKIKIDVCGICNQRCIFCPNAIQNKHHGNIDDQLFCEIIHDAYHAGARELAISATGEPLLNTKLEEYITKAKKLGYEYVFINTNGVLLNECRAKSLMECGLDSIKFSINAGDPKTYCLVHGNDNFNAVIENIKKFGQLRRDTGNRCKLYVSFVAVKETINQAEKLSSLLSGCVDELITMNAVTRGGGISVPNSMLGNDSFSFSYPCGQLFDTAVVLAEGYMTISRHRGLYCKADCL